MVWFAPVAVLAMLSAQPVMRTFPSPVAGACAFAATVNSSTAAAAAMNTCFITASRASYFVLHRSTGWLTAFFGESGLFQLLADVLRDAFHVARRVLHVL